MTRAQYDEVCSPVSEWDSRIAADAFYRHRSLKSSLSHELIAGAASFAAMKAYEDHQEKNGKPASHALAKELLAGFSGAFIDRMVETKGLDAIDKAKAKHHAKEHHDQHFEY
ncbi:hypothetical protein BU15DRAFT_74140 [Melanogaster broomeanus]|nr:hypothetical protein BU15DRAFT_74140 [Melanogaster broomeanus]